MGGAGAYLGGARSPEEILMGVAAGAMTGALNAGLHEMQKELTLREKIGKLSTSLGIPKDVVTKLIRFAAQGRNLNDIKDVKSLLNGLKIAGGLFSAATLVIDAYNYYENRTTSNLIRLFGDAAILASGPVGSAIYGLLDISGINNKVYDFLGNGADKSIEKIRDMYNSINQAGNPINYIPNF